LSIEIIDTPPEQINVEQSRMSFRKLRIERLGMYQFLNSKLLGVMYFLGVRREIDRKMR